MRKPADSGLDSDGRARMEVSPIDPPSDPRRPCREQGCPVRGTGRCPAGRTRPRWRRSGLRRLGGPLRTEADPRPDTAGPRRGTGPRSGAGNLLESVQPAGSVRHGAAVRPLALPDRGQPGTRPAPPSRRPSGRIDRPAHERRAAGLRCARPRSPDSERNWLRKSSSSSNGFRSRTARSWCCGT